MRFEWDETRRILRAWPDVSAEGAVAPDTWVKARQEGAARGATDVRIVIDDPDVAARQAAAAAFARVHVECKGEVVGDATRFSARADLGMKK